MCMFAAGNNRPKCAGVLVFHYGCPPSVISDQKTLYIVVVKKAKQITYPWGFPKGGKEANETVLENALRELTEETGITQDQLSFLSDFPVQEYNNCDLTVLYFVAKFVGDPWKHKFMYSEDELEIAQWMPVADVLKPPVMTAMKPGRVLMLKQTLKQFEEILNRNGSCM
ncbi:RNA pyrophosphohydrolase-like isoform X2 [Corticium candelabrum]|uniref:RNA pyrophosphohydrolase-like isoform X2 n=1 Tax=Corticium candelabrum TaxID=121492 RepID=UPI002E267BE8|nr:RNA pyrophosphohydrolase-like isoform X2 [Corticium candelabrum]